MRSTVFPGSGTLSASAFPIDVRDGLSRTPRQLPSRYLYDGLGSALFEAICRLPWYPLTRAETRLLDTHAGEILSDHVSTVLELGPGSGEKLARLIGATESLRRALDIHIVDVSANALAVATRALLRFEHVRVLTHETTYEAGLGTFARARPNGARSLALFLGSNIGNFDPPDRDLFIRSIRTALTPGDVFLLGADLIKPERDLLLAYDDPLGVTAAFNRNLLVRINRELLGNFDVDGFLHRAVWNAPESRIEMHLVSRRRQPIDIPAAGLEFVMLEGESIWTESSYKFEPAEIVALLERAGFRVTAQWIDAVDRFALTQAEAV